MLGFPKVCSVEPRAQEMSHWGKKERKDFGFLIQLWGQEAKHTLNKLLFTPGHCRAFARRKHTGNL